MDFIRRWMAQVQVHLGQMSVSLKLAIASLAIVVGMIVFLVALYAGQPEMVPVLDQASPPAERAAITSHLEMRGIAYRVSNERILVPVERRLEVIAALQLQQLLPKDTTEGFRALVVENMSWWQSDGQRKQLEVIAKQEVLKQVIRQMRSVQDATVIISLPEDSGFGATRERPTASANLVMQGGTKVNQKLVDAVAGLVSGAVAEMKPEDVTVIDAVAGRQWKVRTDDAVTSDSYLETLQAQERMYRDKIAGLLAYIPNAIVAVNVELDMTAKHRELNTYDSKRSVSLIKSEIRRSETSNSSTRAGEPGARPNTGADIRTADAGGTSSETEENEQQFEPHAGSEFLREDTPRGLPERVSASINIPRSYLVGIYMMDKAEDAPAPTDAVLQPVITEQLDRIRAQVEPLITTASPGTVVVDMYSDISPTPAGGPGVAAAGAGGTMSGPIAFISNLGSMKQFGLIALTLVSLGTMLWMMRKAASPQKIPSPAELAGIPQSLPSDDDVIGEAEEVETALTGVELDEGQIRSRKLVDQVKDMVKTNPAEASSLVHRWVKRSD